MPCSGRSVNPRDAKETAGQGGRGPVPRPGCRRCCRRGLPSSRARRGWTRTMIPEVRPADRRCPGQQRRCRFPGFWWPSGWKRARRTLAGWSPRVGCKIGPDRQVPSPTPRRRSTSTDGLIIRVGKLKIVRIRQSPIDSRTLPWSRENPSSWPSTHGFGIIGCGMIAEFHTHAIGEIEGARVVAAFSRSEANGARIAALAGGDVPDL